MLQHPPLRIDFFGGTHGRFLEYVINVFLYHRDPGDSGPFTELGTAHATDAKYREDCVVLAYPYSFWHNHETYGMPIESEHWLRIVVEDFSDEIFFIIMTNGVTRVEDRGFDAYCTDQSDQFTEIRHSRHRFRNWWYDKIQQRNNHADMKALYCHDSFIHVPQPTFEFRYESLLDWHDFQREFSRLASFLQRSFDPGIALLTVWQNFMARNQGFMSKNHCDRILRALYTGDDQAVTCSVLEEAWINYCVRKHYNINLSGPLWNQDQYPQTTQEIRDCLRTSYRIST